MTADLEGRIRITAKDDSGPAFTALGKRMEHLHKVGQQLAQRAGLPAIGEALHGVGERLGQVREKAMGAVEGLSALAGISLIAGIGGLAEGLRTAAENVDRLGRNARQLDIAVVTLQRADAAAESLGVSSETMNAGLQKAQENYAGLRHHVARFAQQLQGVNPALLAQIRGAKTSGEAFDDMFAAIERARPEDRTWLAEKLFGSADFAKIGAMGGAKFKAAMDEAGVHLGDLTPELTERATKLIESTSAVRESLTGISNAVLDKVAPKLTELMTSLSAFLDGARPKIAEGLGKAITAIGDALANFDWQGFGQSLLSVGQGFKAIADAVGPKMLAIGLLALPFLGLAASVASLSLALGKLSLALLTTPVGWAVMGAALAAVAVWQQWDTVSEKASTLGAALGALPGDLSKLSDAVWNGHLNDGLAAMRKSVDDLATAFRSLDGIVVAVVDQMLRDVHLGWVADLLDRLDKVGKFAPAHFNDPRWASKNATRPYSSNLADPTLQNYRLQEEQRWRDSPAARLWRYLTAPAARTPMPASPAAGRFYARATGGPVARGDWSVVGEKGPELVNWGASGGVMSNLNSASFTSALRIAFESLPTVLIDLTRVLATLADKMTGNAPVGSGGAGGSYSGSGNDGGGATGGTEGGGRAYGGRNPPSAPDMPSAPPSNVVPFPKQYGDPHHRFHSVTTPADPGISQASGAAGQYRPVYRLGPRDLSDAVVNTVAGEARMKNKAGVDAVIDNMFNRLGTKAYGPSQDLAAVARARGQYAGYRHATPSEAALIRARIKAIASGSVPDITKGSNEYRADWYRGPWMRKMGARGMDIGGNVFAYNPKGGRSPYAPYDDVELARRQAQDVARMANIPYAARAANIADQAAQKVDIGKGEVTVTIKPHGATVTGVRSSSSGNMDSRVAIDTTGLRRFQRGMN